MSLVFHSYRSGSVSSLLIAAARQVVIAGAAVAGVMALTGCSKAPAAGTPAAGAVAPLAERPPQQGKANGAVASKPGADGYRAGEIRPGDIMTAPLTPQPAGRLIDPTLPRAAPASQRPDANIATDSEIRRASPEAIQSLINEATTAGPVPGGRRGGVPDVLAEADRAISPLTDTLAAIELGQQAIVENLRHADVPGYKVTRTAVGDGRQVTMQLDVSQGPIQVTERALDIAIQGDGFLPVRIYTDEARDGSIAYTRNGKLYMNRTGDIVVGSEDGYLLLPAIKLPPGVTQVTIGVDGRMQVFVTGSDQPKEIGRISLAVFPDATTLRPLGGGLYAETAASGQASEVVPGSRGAGRLLQGQVERCNVDLLKERMRLNFLQNWRTNLVGAIDGAAGR